MGKYTKVLKDLPKFEEPYDEQVQKLKADYAGMGATQLAEAHIKLRVEKAELEDQIKELNKKLEATRQLGVDAFNGEGLESVKLGTGQSCRLQPEPYPQIVDKELFRLWCLEKGLQSQMHLHSSSASSLCKERLLEGEELPPGTMVFTKEKFVVTGARK